MTSFFDLFVQHHEPASSEAEHAWADNAFRERLRVGPVQIWQPGDSISEAGTRILMGVATWSGYDMRLLDVISESIQKGCAPHGVHVEVFDTAPCKDIGDFRKYIPKLRHVSHTPVVGIWRDGRLHEVKEGYEARDVVAGFFGSSSAEVVAFVQDRLKSPTVN